MHDRRAGEVLHAEPEQPAAGVPDPVRRDGVDECEADAEGEIDPELGSLRHRAPDDCQGYAGEHDLEQVGAGAGNRREERVRRLADRQEGADRREEPVRADHRVPVAERDPEPDRPVDERADPEDKDVLTRDVGGVLHPGQARLEERKPGLHEHDQDGRDDDPDGVGGDQQVRVLHAILLPVR